MIKWLSHPDELGEAPKSMTVAEVFEYDGLKYYIFRFKTKLLSRKWYVGVCGGFDRDSSEHCGHVFSEMAEYSPLTAHENAVHMIEMIKEYWRAQAEEAAPSEEISEEPAPEEEPIPEEVPVSFDGESRAFATHRITVDGCKIGYFFREEPVDETDSGWRFLAGDESEEYLKDLSNTESCTLDTVCKCDNSVIPYLNCPTGTVLIRDGEKFVPEITE